MLKKAKKLVSALTRKRIRWRSTYRPLLLVFALYLSGAYPWYYSGPFFAALSVWFFLPRKGQGRPRILSSLLILTLLGFFIAVGAANRPLRFVFSLAFAVSMSFLARSEPEARERVRTSFWLVSTIAVFLITALILPVVPYPVFLALCILAVFIFTKDAVMLERPPYTGPLGLAAAVTGLVTAEIAWVGSLLPLNRVSYAALSALVFLVFKRLLVARFAGELKAQFTLGQVTLAILILLAALAGAGWQQGY